MHLQVQAKTNRHWCCVCVLVLLLLQLGKPCCYHCLMQVTGQEFDANHCGKSLMQLTVAKSDSNTPMIPDRIPLALLRLALISSSLPASSQIADCVSKDSRYPEMVAREVAEQELLSSHCGKSLIQFTVARVTVKSLWQEFDATHCGKSLVQVTVARV